MEPTSSYRADIDGLRAVAVLLVVFYHYGLGPMSGGFIGVDVFFVISGYLITRILRAEISAGQFSIIRFYERRIRRIVPPLLLVIAATLAAGWFVLMPQDYRSLSVQSAFSLVGLPNYYFWRNTGYFDTDAALLPLLHTWSLAVEEQFYLVWPGLLLLAALGAKIFRAQWFPFASVGIIACASFVWSVFDVTNNPSAAFYLPFSRAWELALGGMLAFAPAIRSRIIGFTAPAFGLALILASSLMITSEMPFPGPLALAPCIGAALIVWPRSHIDPVTAILSTRPMVWVGQISYALYLWHWPVLVLYRHEQGGDLPDFATALVLIGICIALSALTRRFVEVPSRNQRLVSRTSMVALMSVTCGSLLMSAIAIYQFDGLASRLPHDVRAFAEQANHYSPIRDQCHWSDSFSLQPQDSCVLGADVEPDTIVWADSHGVELSDALGKLFAQEGRALRMITYSGCPPVVGYQPPRRTGCEAHNSNVLDFILGNTTKIQTVVLATHYIGHHSRSAVEFGPGALQAVTQLSDSGLDIVILGPIPGYSGSVPSAAARSVWRGESPHPILTIAQLNDARKPIVQLLENLSALPGVTLVDASFTFCDEVECRFIENGRSLLFDHNHPSMYGASLLAADVFEVIQSGASPDSATALAD